MKLIIIAMVLNCSTVFANVNIAPYQKTANRYMVDGKEMSASEAVSAAQSGKTVFKCKVQKLDAIYLVNGKAVNGESLSKCNPQMLAETASGLGFKARK